MNHFVNSVALKCIVCLKYIQGIIEYIEIYILIISIHNYNICAGQSPLPNIHLDLLNFLFTLVTKNRLWHPPSLRHSSNPPSLSGKNDWIKS